MPHSDEPGSLPPDRGSSLVILHPIVADSTLPPNVSNNDDSPTVITPAKPFTPSDPSLGLVPGGKLGNFELIEAVGAGGMAAVLKARDLDLGREVALKILPPQMARDAENVIRFKHEARAAAKLDHDHVARVFACGEDGGLHFIAFEFVEGSTLRELIDRRGVLPAGECVRYMIHVAAGLSHASDRGVVHRDIKPSNIVVTPDGRAKIVDMGLARSLSQPVEGGVTQSGVTLGTFDYISPEQALDPRRADVRSDIYSLGCTFYHALTGRPPVPAGTVAKKLHAHQHEPVVDPRVLNPGVPDELAIVLARMMAKDVTRRFQTPAELIAVLTALAHQLHLAVGPETMPALDLGAIPDPSSVRILPQPPRVPAGLLVGIAAVIVAVVVVAGTSGPDRPAGRVPWDRTVVTSASTSPSTDAGPPTPEIATRPPETPSTALATTRDELIGLLRNPAVTEIRLAAGQRYDLTDDSEGIAVVGRRLMIDGGSADRPEMSPVIRVAAVAWSPTDPTAPRPGSLTVAKSELVRVTGVRFEVAAGRGIGSGRSVGLLVADAGSVELSECRFTIEADPRTADSSCVAVVRSTLDTSTALTARHCYFGPRRGSGVELTGRVVAAVTESAFAPGNTAFSLRNGPVAATDSGAVAESSLSLTHCTFLLEHGSVAEVEAAARWRVTAGLCVFAAPPSSDDALMATSPPESTAVPACVLRSLSGPGLSRFVGRDSMPNAYYRVAPFVLGRVAYTFEELSVQRAVLPSATDAAAVELTQSPWAEVDPVAALQGAEPWKAVRLNPAIRAVRSVPAGETILGVRALPRPQTWVYDPYPPRDPNLVINSKIKIFYPHPTDEERDSLPRNVYEKLQAAVGALEPGDELQLKFNGVLAIPDTIAFPANTQLRVTVRPAPGYTPVLAIRPNRRYEPTLFRVAEGEVTFDGVEFLLRKDVEDAVRSMAAVTVVAGRQCVLRNCVITVDEQSDEKVAVVVVADPSSEMMRTAGGTSGPRVRMENCLVRGRGRAVWVQSARPFELDVKNTLTALSGSVVVVDPPARSPIAGTALVHLDRVTAALGGPLLDLRHGRPTDDRMPGWVMVEVRADRCMFAPMGPGVPLVTVDGGDTTAPTRSFTWTTLGTNWYANYNAADTFLEVIPADAMDLTRMFDADEWFGITSEKPAQSLGTVTFAGWPTSGKATVAILPADLRPTSADFPTAVPRPLIGDAGVSTASLPRPAAESPDEP